ncbi:HNH endonuclease [Dolichospermum sp. LEGE 00240]|uniref:HNH endonuclease n=1 Tax=Dolichospermum sp. LEGE 00240 TaxID=1828603 RepID=UPI0018822115|nr:HNH endonuclease [Dolichospermum sp. LEGE 00240]MDM3846499.1 HNH endonuclease signature motif containing protein [Aphanizomenon gracile PMC638.10]MDM3852806.1 HNH endonuclease signature motif containing protein [Aphanizomenon gracile PMC627.10]MDM3855585.1 HNH endonuclease signature motif containing protein [Aphanizomenon gracile PMC649.10]MDM3861227.1 HNH endonuclease signature motif containing protein [Aphanizomenon gracile PMC644.10]
MSTYISESLRQKIIERDKSRCCYCLTSEANSGIPMTYDHIHPVSKGGETTFENLCLACRSCNEFKSDAVESIDPLSGDGTRLEGINAIGRTTIVKLRINNPVILIARKRWVISGWHPPLD